MFLLCRWIDHCPFHQSPSLASVLWSNSPSVDTVSPKSILSSFGELLKGPPEFQELPKGPLRQKEP